MIATFPFKFEQLPVVVPAWGKEKDEPSWQEAYYQLMDWLIPLQIEAIHRAMGSRFIKKLIVEGGFTKNRIFIELLRKHLPDHVVEVDRKSTRLNYSHVAI